MRDDDDALEAFVFAVVFGLTLIVKGWQHFLGNLEASAVRDPLRTIRWCLGIGLVAGALALGLVWASVGGDERESALEQAAAACPVE